MKTKISLPVVISLIMSFIILSTPFTSVMAVNKTTTATVMSYSGSTSGSGIFVGTNQNSEAGNENGAPCITGVTVSQTGGKIYSNRIGYVEFAIDRPTSEITNAKLMLYITSVNENLSGWMKLACYRTTGAPQNAVLGKGSSAAGYPAVNNDYSYSAAYWSNEIYPSSANSWKEINITKAVEDACSEQTDSDKITLKFRLQVPQAGLNISTQSPYLPKIVISDGTPEEDKNEYTRTGLFTHNMLSDNPGEVGYTSRYEHGDFMTERGYDGMTFSLFEAAQYGLLWDQYDKDRGIALTEEDYLKNPNDSSVSQMNAKKVFPYGSKERKWVEEKRAEIIKMYSDAKKNGQKIYFMQDVIVLPTSLKNSRSDIQSSGKIDIRKAETQEVMDYMYDEMFTDFCDENGTPLIDGIYVRYGETYTGSSWGIPYHTGNNPIMGDSTQTHLLLMNYLRNKICVGYDKEIIYRTWGFGAFQYDPNTYLTISNQLEPHKNFYFAIKHTAGDFHRTFTFNQTLNIGQHQQIVEVQAAREYEGKGAYPNYIAGGVINGFEEYSFLMSDDETQSLRDVINVENSMVKGIWTWSRGGGWAGPYINGLGYPNNNPSDPNKDKSDKSIPVINGSEMWCDLNSFVINKWAKDTSVSDEDLVKEYAREELKMNETDAQSFYDLCKKSSMAVLLGRARNTDKYGVDVWWTRDDGIQITEFNKNINNAYKNSAADVMLAEKAESVKLWKEMIDIAYNLDDRLYDVKLADSDTSVKEYIIMTTEYGYYLFDIFNQMHIASVERLKAQAIGESSTPAMNRAVLKYDQLWAEWQKEYDENKLKGYPTLYAKTKSSFTGYNSLVYSKPFDDIMASFPRLPAGKKFEADNVTAQGADNPQYAADGDINTAFTAGYQSESEYPKKYIRFEFDQSESIDTIVVKKQKITLSGNTSYWADHAYAAGCVLEGSFDGENWETIYTMNTKPDGTDSQSEVVINLARPNNYKFIQYIRKEKNSYIGWADAGGNKLILADIEFYTNEEDKPEETPIPTDTPAPAATPIPTDTPAPAATPEPTMNPDDIPAGTGVHKYHGNTTDITGGNPCDNKDPWSFLDGVDEKIKALFADPDDATKVDDDLIKNYLNYVGGTDNNASHPTIKLTAPMGKYKIVYLGYGNESAFTATIGDKKLTVADANGTRIAVNDNDTNRVMKYYTMDLVLDKDVTDATITFDTTSSWLPDLYAIVIAGEAELVKPAVYNGKVDLIRQFSGDGYVGEASAFKLTFEIEDDASYNKVNVAVGEKSVEKTFTTLTGGGVVYGIVVDAIITAEEITATATLAE